MSEGKLSEEQQANPNTQKLKNVYWSQLYKYLFFDDSLLNEISAQ